jgi:sulfoxide reductase catalytic subunit YedY
MRIRSSEITPKAVYLRRREFLALGAAGAGALLLPRGASAAAAEVPHGRKLDGVKPGQPSTDEKKNSFDEITHYNNFYEFGTDKSDPVENAHTLQTSPWSVEVTGLVKKPAKYALEDLVKLAPQEERIYRLRCVEGWSMVIPWVGYSLSKLIERVQPMGNAKYVEFVSLADKKTMPYVNSRILDWPYTEGLRMDEAMHPLTLLTFGMYGEVLPKQNGAPLRMVVPWKYGFKSAKSIVKIRFAEKQPPTAWNKAAANEYGFYSNVNPNVDHPRWSQATERRIGEDGLFAKKRKTLMFNGYEPQVGQLYAGMDLKKNF